MRDLIESEREFGRAMLADLTARPARPLAEPADGKVGSFGNSGSQDPRDAAQRPSYAVSADQWSDAMDELDAIYAAAAKVMADAGPIEF